MKGKFMIIAALLGALTFGACVDSTESASVTAIRNAKAEQLKSVATLNNAKAQAEATLAAAEAQLAAAQAQLIAAEAAKLNAETEEQKIANQLAAAEAQAAIAALEAQLEIELLQLEQELLKAQAALKAEGDAMFNALYLDYTNSLRLLYEAQKALSDANLALVAAENDVVSLDTAYANNVAAQNKIISKSEANIASAQAYLEILREAANGGMSKSEAEAYSAYYAQFISGYATDIMVAAEKVQRVKEAAVAVDSKIATLTGSNKNMRHAYYKAYLNFLSNNNKLSAANVYEDDDVLKLDGNNINAKLDMALTVSDEQLDTDGDNKADTWFWGFSPKKWNTGGLELGTGGHITDKANFVKVAYASDLTKKVAYDVTYDGKKGKDWVESKHAYNHWVHYFDFVGEDVATAYAEIAASYVEKTYGATVVVAEAKVEAAAEALEDASDDTLNNYEYEIEDLKSELEAIEAEIAEQLAIIADCQYQRKAFSTILSTEDMDEIKATHDAAYKALKSTKVEWNNKEYNGLNAKKAAIAKALEDKSNATVWKKYVQAVKEHAALAAAYEAALGYVEAAAAELTAMQENNESWVESTITAHNNAGLAIAEAMSAKASADNAYANLMTTIDAYDDIVNAYIDTEGAAGEFDNTVSALIDQYVTYIGSNKAGAETGEYKKIADAKKEIKRLTAAYESGAYDKDWAVAAAEVAVAQAEAKLAYYEAKVAEALAALDAFLGDEE